MSLSLKLKQANHQIGIIGLHAHTCLICSISLHAHAH